MTIHRCGDSAFLIFPFQKSKIHLKICATKIMSDKELPEEPEGAFIANEYTK
jgi:hypothetical protein